MINAKMAGMLLAAFVVGSFVASPELRAYAANTVFSADIKDGEVKTLDLANNAVTSAKIKNGEVKADDIATDAVGASELKGVDKLMFADCALISASVTVDYGETVISECTVAGLDTEDNVIVPNNAYDCFNAEHARIRYDGNLEIIFKGACSSALFKSKHVPIIIYDELPDKVSPG